MGKWDRRASAKGVPGGVISTVVERVQVAATAIGVEGTAVPFGSHASSLTNANSDCDVTFLPREDVWGEAALQILERFAAELPSHGFRSIVRIFQASIPLIKAIDQGGMEVDLCIGNHLGLHNSRLVSTYCQLDPRVGEVCRAVKQWAKATELVGSSDGHLNSYAYTLLTLYYLMSVTPPVVPNLQDLAGQSCEPVPVIDRKWGREMTWDCRFWEELLLLPKSQNNDSAEKLLKGFFRFYLEEFDWSTQAVSIRLALTKQGAVPKFNLGVPVTNDGWYVEDPFDLRHNLASNCVKEGRQRILRLMGEALRVMSEGGLQGFNSHCSSRSSIHFILKCRVHTEKVSLDRFLEAISGGAELKAFTVHFPTPQASRAREVADAFLVFNNEECRRKVHQLNESALGEWQLRFMPCSSWALEDAMAAGEYKEVPVATQAVPLPERKASAADQAASEASEKVRSGLRAAKTVEEVMRLIELARTHSLKHEEGMGLKRLKQIEGSAGGKEPAKQSSGGSSVAYQ